MIPVRVELRNFLSYKDDGQGGPVVFDFSGDRLWSIAGVNGSGKSAVFDAITYSLYGHHRGGKNDAAQLMHKGQGPMEVRYRFLFNGAEYEACRRLEPKTRSNPKSVTELNRRDGAGEWRLVEGTDSPRGMTPAVEALFGFGFDTFVASLLLRQGEADRLLLADPKPRFDLFAKIIDLERFRKLEEAADERQKVVAAEVRGLEVLISGKQPPSGEEMAAAQAAIEVAEAARKDLEQEQKEALDRHNQAQEKKKLQAQRADAVAKQQRAQDILAEADIREDAYARSLAVDRWLPILHQINGCRGDIRTADAAIKVKLEELTTLPDLIPLQRQRQEQQLELEGARIQLKALRPEIEKINAEQKQLPLETARQANWFREQAQALEEQQADIEMLEAEWHALDEAHRRGEQAKLTLPALRQLAETQKALGDLVKEAAPQSSPEARLEWLGEQKASQKALVDELQQACERAIEQLNDRRAVEISARSMLEARLRAQEEGGVCSLCGQHVTPQHARREVELTRTALYEAASEFRTSEDTHKETKKRYEDAEERLGALKQEELVWTGKLREADRLERERTSKQEEIGQWDLESAQEAVKSMEDRGWRWLAVKAQIDRLPGISEQIEAYQKSALKCEDQLREKTADWVIARDRELEEELAPKLALQQTLDGRSTEADEARIRLDGEIEDVKQQRSVIEAEIAQLTSKVTAGDATIKALRVSMPAEWGELAERGDDAELEELDHESERTVAIKERKEELEQAKADGVVLKLRIQYCDGELERLVSIPSTEETAEAVEGIGAQLERARVKELQMQGELQKLQSDREHLQQLSDQRNAAELKRSRWAILRTLLGRNGLQGALLKESLVSIEDLANETLERISSGELAVRLILRARGQSQDLVIQAADQTRGGEMVDAEFLSGGQQFRLAVAVAAGIGQHAGLGREGLRSLIVDEGFGSLDETGQKEMLTEIRALSEHLERVIVVSHQDAFADERLFPSSFHLTRVDGETKVALA